MRAGGLESVGPHAAAIHADAPEIEPMHTAQRVDTLIGDLVGEHDLALPGHRAKHAVSPCWAPAASTTRPGSPSPATGRIHSAIAALAHSGPSGG